MRGLLRIAAATWKAIPGFFKRVEGAATALAAVIAVGVTLSNAPTAMCGFTKLFGVSLARCAEPLGSNDETRSPPPPPAGQTSHRQLRSTVYVMAGDATNLSNEAARLVEAQLLAHGIQTARSENQANLIATVVFDRGTVTSGAQNSRIYAGTLRVSCPGRQCEPQDVPVTREFSTGTPQHVIDQGLVEGAIALWRAKVFPRPT